MIIHEYNQFPINFNLSLATPRPPGAPSTVIVAAKKHEEYLSQVRAALREFKHIDPTTKQIPAALRLETYLPTASAGGRTEPLYALRTLAPAGSIREVDVDSWQDVARIRYSALLVFLPAYFAADERVASAIERHLEKAVLDLFTYLGLPTTYIPGDDSDREEDRTIIDLIVEVGPAEGAPGRYEVPAPTT